MSTKDDKENENKDVRSSHFSNKENTDEFKNTFQTSDTAISRQVQQSRFPNYFPDPYDVTEVQNSDLYPLRIGTEEFNHNKSSCIYSPNVRNIGHSSILDIDSGEIINTESNFIDDYTDIFLETYEQPNASVSVTNNINNLKVSSLSGEFEKGESSTHATQFETAFFSISDDTKQPLIPLKSQFHDTPSSTKNSNMCQMKTYFGPDSSIPTREDESITFNSPTSLNMQSHICQYTASYSADSFKESTYDHPNILGTSMDLNLFSDRKYSQQHVAKKNVNPTEVRTQHDEESLTINLPTEEDNRRHENTNKGNEHLEAQSSKYKNKRKNKTPEQKDYLCSQYLIDTHPSNTMCGEIALKIGLEKQSVILWFREKRRRDKDRAKEQKATLNVKTTVDKKNDDEKNLSNLPTDESERENSNKADQHIQAQSKFSPQEKPQVT